MKMEECRVIIADDEANIRFFLKNVAKLLNMPVVGEAEDGAQAVVLCEKERPNLVLMDINMPNQRGDDALKKILAIDPSATVIMLTSVADTEIVKACIQAGAANYILKNNKLDKIKQLIRETVEKI